MRSLLCLALLPSLVAAWSRYAQPIQMSAPNKDGVYEFDFVVDRKLTMSFAEKQFGHRFPVDYDVDTESWSFRDPDQLVGCHDSFPFDVYNGSNKDAVADILSLDGLHYRVVSINGRSPGPLLAVPFGAEVHVRVTNQLMLDSFTVHFHGIDKQGLWYEDGVAFVQQCPITTMSKYDYRFLVDRAGTHWYHGHLQTDRGDGLLGGLVVYNEDRTVPVVGPKRVLPSREYFVMLQDWDKEDSSVPWLNLREKVMKWMYGFDGNEKCWQPTRVHDGGNVGGATPFSAILFNDKGWHSQDDLKRRPHALPLETFRIKKGEDILFRVVNGGLAQELMVHVEGHQMTVVAADGNEVKPMKVDKLVIFPGERYDILVKGLANPKKKVYHMIAETIQYYFFDWSHIETTFGIANVEYEDVREADRLRGPANFAHPGCSVERKCSVLNCPFESYPPDFPFKCLSYGSLENAFEIDDKEIVQDTPFKSGFEEHFINMHYDSHVNGFKFETPRGMPFYYRENLSEVAKDCAKINCARNHSKFDENCRCFYHLTHKLNNIVQLTLYNMGTGGGLATGYAHPFHIHSTHVYVMKVGWPKYNASGMISGMNGDLPCHSDKQICDDLSWTDRSWADGAVKGMNTRSPSLRDAVLIPVGGYVVLRFRAVNPGWWFAHCHLELHTMGGSAYAFRVGSDDEIPSPPPDFPHSCGVYKRNEVPERARKMLRERMERERRQRRLHDHFM